MCRCRWLSRRFLERRQLLVQKENVRAGLARPGPYFERSAVAVPPNSETDPTASRAPLRKHLPLSGVPIPPF